MRKKLFFCLSLLCVFSFLNAQQNPKVDSLFFTLGTSILINTDSALKSAPSPVLFSGGFGANIAFTHLVAFSPYASFFMNYYLWADNKALPAEIENRTALVPSLLIDAPVIFRFNIQNTFASTGLGLSVLARYGFASQGVPSSDIEHVTLINNYLWEKLRWLYLSLQASWDFPLPNGLALGTGVRIYMPASFIADKDVPFAHNMIISANVRLHLKIK